jgi:uncharacterized protein (TIGR02996 family)
MSTSHESAFLRDIHEHPDDDDVRLIYADWLAENGQPERAEFIRIQIELEKLPQWSGRARALRVQESKLFDTHVRGGAWVSHLPELDGITWEFERGCIGGVTASPADSLSTHARAVFRAAPVREVWLNGDGGQPGLAWLRQAGRVHFLAVYNAELRYEKLARVLGSQHTGSLRTLYLHNCGISADEVALVAAAPRARQLDRLHFAEDDLVLGGGDALAASPGLPNLTQLVLNGTGLGDDGLSAIASSSAFPNLRVLGLEYTHLSDTGVADLAASRHLTGLTSLNLGYNPVGDAGAEALAASPNLTGLLHLGLSKTDIGEAGLKALAASPYLTKLEVLELEASQSLTPAGLAALTGPAGLPSLTRLCLGKTKLTLASARALAASPRPSLELDLHDCVVPAKGRRLLRKRFGDRLEE